MRKNLNRLYHFVDPIGGEESPLSDSPMFKLLAYEVFEAQFG